MKVNRTLDHELLVQLSNCYPEKLRGNEIAVDAGYGELYARFSYLKEHGLVNFSCATSLAKGEKEVSWAVITAAGLDFIADDGGLSAILGVVTVKLHDDTIRQLLISKIQQSDGEGGVKASLIKRIKELPSDGVGKLAEAALEKGGWKYP